MNVTTQEQQQQSPLHAHYDRANQAFQTGDYAQALKELTAAHQHAQSDDQRAHIDQSIRTVKEMIQDQNDNIETQDIPTEKPGEGANKLLLLTVLVGLICLTPIVMKMIEIFSEPSAQTGTQTVASAPANSEGNSEANGEQNSAVEGNAATTGSDVESPSTPQATPNMIINTENGAGGSIAAPASGDAYRVTANKVNLRSEASTSSSPITRLSLNQNVSVLEHQSVQANGYSWSKIETAAGDTGWIASKFLAPNAAANTTANSQSTPASATASGVSKTVNGQGVSVRTAPSTSGQRLISLTQAQVTVLSDVPVEADGYSWTKIRTANGTEGWIASQFLQ